MKNQSIGKRIGILSRAMQSYFRYRFKKLSIGHAQVMTLHFLSRNNGLSQNEAVKYFKMDKSSITSQLKYLEKSGYIKREPDEKDNRKRRIYITDKTKSIRPDLYEIFTSRTEILLQNFDSQEKELVFELLDKMIAKAQQRIKKLKESETDK